MNNGDSKNEKPSFVLNEVIKRKILDMYKISKSEDVNTGESGKTPPSNDKS